MKRYTFNLKSALVEMLMKRGATISEAEYISSVLTVPGYDEYEIKLREQGMSADHLADIMLNTFSR